MPATRFSVSALVAMAVVSATWGGLLKGAEVAPPAALDAAAANTLDTQEFHIRNARLPGIQAARQNVTAWHITQGSWNGQTLDGLFIVLVQSASEDGTTAHTTNCYVSHEATPAQRTALVGAFLASNTQLIPSQDMAGLRIEPGVISIQVAGQSVILHLGLVA